MTKCDVSVIIPAHIKCRDDRDFLDTQLEGLERQDYTNGFEVIVADNRSPESLRDHIKNHPFRNSLKLKYIDASAVRSAAHARNVGAEVALGTYLLFCDHDDLVKDNWVSSLVTFLDAGYDLASSAVEGWTLNTAQPRKLATIPSPDRFQPEGAFAPLIVGTSMACRADVYRKLGGMNVTYSANEDVAFGWSARREGYRTGFLAEALVSYRYRSGFRAGWRQGLARGIGLARLNAEFPDNGLPTILLTEVLWQICTVAAWRNLAGEERGLLIGIGVGQLIGGHRFRTLRWRHS
ncbi:glycosyltransferase [Nocardia brasiliensis]|uniref:glycosyltransferase n=1 Tax=Nocardia brasiliensis TaxID=37326 RepID=UPI002458CBB8|nr:glycosyltransferase [Nocardia brasiliensis]